jgi:EmrB/QacA subfamily drug resistance transporter
MITEVERNSGAAVAIKETPAPAPASASAPTTYAEQADPRRWKALPVVLLAAVMDLIDASIVILALPIVGRELHADYAALQWTVAAYSLAFAVMLITGGRLGDIYGRKRIFMLGVAGFTVASALCGFSTSIEMLIAARALQGAMAGLMVPQVLAMIQVGFPPRERTGAYAAYGAAAGLGNVLAPLLAGILLEWNLFDLTWRSIFLINLPIGLFTLGASWLLLRESRSPHPLRLDVGGVVLASVSLLLLLVPLVQGRELGWPAWSWVALTASVPAFALFLAYERRKERRDGSPLVAPALFRRRAFVAGLLVALCLTGGLVAFFVVYVLYLQVGLAVSPLTAGLISLPWPIGIAAASGVAVRLAPRVGRSLVTAGLLTTAAGMLGMLLAVAWLGPDGGIWPLLPGLLLGGVGLGLVFPTLADFVLAGVEERDAGAASGVLNTVMQVGGAAGVAVIGVIFFELLAGQGVSEAGAAPGVEPGPAFAFAFQWALVCQTGLFLLGAALTRLLPPKPVVHAEE